MAESETPVTLLERANQAEAAGNLNKALRFYQRLSQYLDQADLYKKIGALLIDLNREDEAVEALTRALAQDAQDPETYYNLGLARRRQKQFAAAIEALRQAVSLAPEQVLFLNILNDVERDAGASTQPIGTVWLNLAEDAEARGESDRAEELLRQALHTPAVATAAINLSSLLIAQQRLDEAVEVISNGLNHEESDQLLINLGVAYRRQRRHYLARLVLERALALKESALVHVNLGLVANELCDYQRAISHYDSALRLDPHLAPALGGKANSVRASGRLTESLVLFGEALKLDKDNAYTHYGYAEALLKLGRLLDGWQEYEFRHEIIGPAERHPTWRGEPVNGRRVLLTAEQGIGDNLLALRYARLLHQRGAEVVYECPSLLLTLIGSQDYISQCIKLGAACEYNFACRVMSLPGLFQEDFSETSRHQPYLSLPDAVAQFWESRLAHLQGFKVGICWQGNPELQVDVERSFPLAHFQNLAEIPGVELINLQKGNAGTVQIPDFLNHARLHRVDDDDRRTLEDTAAIMQQLDLVISPCTSMAHLAGALGVPTWVLLNTNSDWRWFSDTTDSPWYPSARLFRQNMPGDWQSVFAEVRTALVRLVDS